MGHSNDDAFMTSKDSWHTDLLNLPSTIPAGLPAAKVPKHRANTLMWKAIDADDPLLMSEALRQGASWLQQRYAHSALQEVLVRGQLDAVAAIVAAGAELNPKNDHEQTPLKLIAPRDNPSEFVRLCQLGLKPEQYPKASVQALFGAPRLATALAEHLGPVRLRASVSPGLHRPGPLGPDGPGLSRPAPFRASRR
jgi:hypothetical protein